MTAVLSQPNNATAHERDDDGVRAEDSFRRAAFLFARAAEKLAASSTILGPNTKVAHSALVDIKHARDILDKLFMPAALKASPAFADTFDNFTADVVRKSVSSLAKRIEATTDEVRTIKYNRGADLSAPVRPKQGKMLWAGVDCPVCPSIAGQRCRKEDGTFSEKPHPQRKSIAE